MTTDAPLVSRHTLRELDLTERLAGNAFDEIARKTRVEQLAAGRPLFLRGHSDHWTFYLLEGRLELKGADGSREELVGGSVAARKPIGGGIPREATATALTPLRFIRIDNTLLEILGSVPNVAVDYTLTEIDAEDELADNRLFHRLYHDYMENRLELPHLPDIAFKVQAAARDPETGPTTMAHIIQGDPVLAGKLLQVANSPLYGVQSPIYNIRAAVVYLGMELIRNLVMTYTLHHLFRSRHPLLQRRMAQLWRDSTLVSALCYVLAEETAGLDPDRAMLAGLLHDIGALPVISYADAFPELSEDEAQLEQALEHLRGQLGAMVLRHWQFGTEMVAVALQSRQWWRDPQPQADYADAAVIAQLMLAQETPLMHTLPAPEEVPAYRKLARGSLNAEHCQELLQRAREAVTDVLQLLH